MKIKNATLTRYFMMYKYNYKQKIDRYNRQKLQVAILKFDLV